MGDARQIEVGDWVAVYFELAEAEWYLRVVAKPVATGDCWKLTRRDGTPVNVQHFAKMVQIPEPTP